MRWTLNLGAAVVLLCSSRCVSGNHLRGRRILTEDGVTRGMVDLVHLIPFNVQIAVTMNIGIQQHEVSSIVTGWLNDSFREQLLAMGYTEANSYAAFDSVVLFNNNDDDENDRQRRNLQQGELYTAKFRGGAVFSRDEITRTRSVPKDDVLLMQQKTLLNDGALANRLRASRIESLGAVVADVNAFLNPLTETSSSSGSLHLESIIIGAIVVASVAFLFLLGAVYWAYRYDRQKQEAYKHAHNRSLSAGGVGDRTDTSTARDETTPEMLYPPVMEIADASNYPESVISDSVVSGSVVSEDISASLSQYYKAGMGRVASSSYRGSAMLSDAGSVSSMESYGYSIDAGTAIPLPSEVSLKGGCDEGDGVNDSQERIGGLPVAPGLDSDIDDDEVVEDVQIPDLYKELKMLDIQLTPSTDSPSDVESIDQPSATPSQLFLEEDAISKSPVASAEPHLVKATSDEKLLKLEDAFDLYWNQAGQDDGLGTRLSQDAPSLRSDPAESFAIISSSDEED